MRWRNLCFMSDINLHNEMIFLLIRVQHENCIKRYDLKSDVTLKEKQNGSTIKKIFLRFKSLTINIQQIHPENNGSGVSALN